MPLHQPRLSKGARQPVGSAFMEHLERAVEREMKVFNVSRSFVIATAVAYALGVKDQANYRTTERKRRRKHGA